MDLDDDGKKDLLVGDYYGNVTFYRNLGTDAEPAFGSGYRLQSGGTDLKVPSYAKPEAVDWDNDGDMDLLLGDQSGFLTLFQNESVSGAEDVAVTPVGIRLEQNYPNPFNETTVISYTIEKSGPVKLSILDIRGRLITELVDAVLLAGEKNVVWEGQDGTGQPVPSGVYFCQLRVGTHRRMKKISLIK